MPIRPLACAAASLMLAAAAPVALSPEQYIATRQASLDMSSIAFQYLRGAARDGTDVTSLAYPTRGLARWAKVLPTLFPAGTGEGATKTSTQARAEVWADHATFEAAAARYAAATDRLAELAKAGDVNGYRAGLDEVKAACDACHAKFKDGPK